MADNKDFWIKLFIKKCTRLSSSREQLNAFFEWCEKTYNVSDSYLSDLKEKHTIEEYTNKLIPVIDQYFTIEDIKEILKFYSTDVGKKMLDLKFLRDIGKVGVDMNMDIEQDFARGHNKT